MAITAIVHSFLLGDSEDPELYASVPIWEWQQTEAGKWVMEHAIEQPTYSILASYDTYSYRCVIRAKLQEVDLTFFKLKYDNSKT